MKNDLKKFKRSDWKKMEIIHEPTERDPQIRKDDEGQMWAWQSSGKYVHAKPWFYRNDLHRISKMPAGWFEPVEQRQARIAQSKSRIATIQPCEKCGLKTNMEVLVFDRWASWCGCSNGFNFQADPKRTENPPVGWR